MSHNISHAPADIVIHVLDSGIVLKEKSLIAFRKSDNKIVAAGTEAEQLIGRDNEDLVIMSPLRQGIVIDYIVTVELFSYFLRKALGKKPIRKPTAAVCVPKGITEIEKHVMEDVLLQIGIGTVWMTDMPAPKFIPEFSANDPKRYRKLNLIIDITKDDPSCYIEEQIQDILTYAEWEQISQETVYALFQKSFSTSGSPINKSL